MYIQFCWRKIICFLSLIFLVQVGTAKEVADSIEQRLKACTACHGQEGRASTGDYYPRIAGKPAGYLLNQLKNFRDGRRTYPLMNYLIANLSDAYLEEIAAYFAAQHPPYAASQNQTISASQIRRGQQLAQEGDRQHDLPACIACHGERLTGVAPFVPGLLGLPRDYLVAQLGAWQVGTRKAKEPDCMHSLVLKLSSEDIAAVAAWLALQPVPVNAIPAESFKQSPPLHCGSIFERKAK